MMPKSYLDYYENGHLIKRIDLAEWKEWIQQHGVGISKKLSWVDKIEEYRITIESIPLLSPCLLTMSVIAAPPAFANTKPCLVIKGLLTYRKQEIPYEWEDIRSPVLPIEKRIEILLEPMTALSSVGDACVAVIRDLTITPPDPPPLAIPKAAHPDWLKY